MGPLGLGPEASLFFYIFLLCQLLNFLDVFVIFTFFEKEKLLYPSVKIALPAKILVKIPFWLIVVKEFSKMTFFSFLRGLLHIQF